MASKKTKAAKAARKAAKATGEAASAASAATAREEGAITVRVAIDPTEDTPVYYTNYAEAAMAAHELALMFARVPTKLSSVKTEETKQTGVIKMEPVVQVVFAPTLLPGLIRALNKIKELYEQRVGPIQDRE